MSEVVGPDTGRRSGTRGWPWWTGLLVGAGAAVLGLLPWLVTGLRLPIQNLWATETFPEQMPRALLPFSQYAITLIVALIVTGAVAAGLCARAARRRLPRRSVLAVLSGVLVVQLGALVQTAVVVQAGLAGGFESAIYIAVLVAVTVTSVVVGVLTLALIAAGPPAAAVVGMSVGAVALAPWLSRLIVPLATVAPTPSALQLLAAARWVPAVLVGVVIAWAGLRTLRRALAGATGLLLLWVVPALTTAIAASAGTRVLARRPAEMAQFAAQVFSQALTTPAQALPPLLVALVVAAVGILGRFLRRRGRDQSVSTSRGSP